MRIAMWSGPRNLSTAMMYSFAARGDCAVWDEPFYAAFLKVTRIAHPMADEVIAAHEPDPEIVARRCAGPIPGGKDHFYLKVMPHHMVDGFPMDWARECVNVHLIRHPARVIASYGAKRDAMTLDDIGFQKQLELFGDIGGIVIDSHDIRDDPETMLRVLCEAIGLSFLPAMLNWPAGGHAQDGIWSKHWYGAVHKSSGFAGPEGPLPGVEPNDRPLFDQAMPAYEALKAQALRG